MIMIMMIMMMIRMIILTITCMGLCMHYVTLCMVDELTHTVCTDLSYPYTSLRSSFPPLFLWSDAT